MSRNEIGESISSMVRRADANAWPRVYVALKDGATLYRPLGLDRFYTRCKDSRDPNDSLGISARFVKEQAQSGLLIRCGVDEYQLGNAEEFATVEPPTVQQMGLF